MNINRIKQSNILVSTNPSSALQSPSLFEKEDMLYDARIKENNVCNKAIINDWSIQDNLSGLTFEFISSESNLHSSSLQESRSVLPWKEVLTIYPSLESNSLETIHSLLLDNGQMYESKQDYPRAIDSYEKSKSIALSILANSARNTLPLALSLKAIGDIYERQRLYEVALQYYTAAIPYYSKSDQHTFQLLGYTYKNIAFIYGYKMNNLKKSTQYYNNAMKIFQLCHGMQHEITQRCLLDTKEVEKYHRLQKNGGVNKKRRTRRRFTRRGGRRRRENEKAIYVRNE